MRTKDATRWLCENARELEKFSGQWVSFNVNEGVVSKGASLENVLKHTQLKKKKDVPFVLFVPSKNEMGIPFPALKRK